MATTLIALSCRVKPPADHRTRRILLPVLACCAGSGAFSVPVCISSQAGHLAAGDKLMEIESNQPAAYSLASVTQDGKKRVLLVNKRGRTFDVTIAGANGGRLDYVDQATGFQPPATKKLRGDTLRLAGYSVAVVTLP